MSNTMTTADTTTTTNPVSWFEVHTAQPQRAKDFYGAVFGWSFDDSMPGYSMIQLGEGAPIGGGIADSGGAYPDGAVFVVQVPDVVAALDAAAANGGSIVAAAKSMPTGLSFGYAANPDGSVFGVWSPPADG